MSRPGALGAIAIAILTLVGPGDVAAQTETDRKQARGAEAGYTAPRGDHTDVYHGVEVADPYRWMEDLDSPATTVWAAAQDSAARALLSRGRHTWRPRVEGFARVRAFTGAFRRGDRYFYARFQPTGPARGMSLYVRGARTGEPELLVDADRLRDAEGVVPGTFVPSPDGRVLAYGTRVPGSNWETIRLLRVGHGLLADSLRGFHAGASVLRWAPDGSGFYYTRFELPPDGEERTARLEGRGIWFHRIGTRQGEDRRVFVPRADGGDPFVAHRVTADGRFLVISVSPAGMAGNRVLALDLEDPGGEPVELWSKPTALFRFAGSRGDRFWFHTDLDAPNGRVVAIDLEHPDRPVEVVPEDEDVISTWVGIEPVGVNLVGERLLVGYVRDGVLAPRTFSLDGEPLATIALPEIGSVWSGFVGGPDSPEVTFTLSGLLDPASLYRLDLDTGRSELVGRADLPHDPTDFETNLVFYPGEGGVRVPMFLVHRRGLEIDGTSPVVLYGYGFGGWDTSPYAQPAFAAFVQEGGIWGLAAIRGDGVYGSEWRDAGSGRNKPTAIADYLAAARWLVSEGYTTADRLVANTSSAGGAVVAAAVLRSPESFGAAILDYPVLDMLRYHEFTGARRWIPGYGTAEDPADFEVLRKYSPYHTLTEGECYPPILVAPGELDQVTPPLHAYKFVAAARHAQACGNPVLMRVAWGAGHSSGATVERSIEAWADQLAFLDLVLPGGIGGQPGSGLSAADSAAVAAADRAYADAWLAGDAGTVMSTLHADAVIVPSGMDARQGSDAVREFWFPADSPPTVVERYELDQEEVGGVEGLAYVRGTFELAFRYDGELHETRGTYLTLLRPDEAGEWRISHRTWNDH